MNIIAENIARRRKELGMTQRELAEKLNISDKTLSRWETDKQVPDALMIPELAKALDMSINELYGIVEVPREKTEQVSIEAEEKPDSGKIAVYKIALLLGVFLSVIGGWIYLYWLGTYARFAAIILLLMGIITILFAEIAFEEFSIRNNATEIYEEIHHQWFGIIVPIMGLIIGVVLPALKSGALALFHTWDMILPIVLLQLMCLGLYVRNYNRLKSREADFDRNRMMGVGIWAAVGILFFFGYIVYAFLNPYSNSLSAINNYDEWFMDGGWLISRVLELGTGISFLCMNILYSKNILGIFRKGNESVSFRDVLKKAAKVLVAVVLVICMVVIPVVTAINRTLSKYVSSVSGMVPYEEIMAFEPDLIGWIHECNRGGEEVYALRKMTYVQGTEKYGDSYLFYFPHGSELTETEVTYKIGSAGKILKLQAENSTSIIGNEYYMCYVEVTNDMEETELKVSFDGEEIECEAEHTNLQLKIFGDGHFSGNE